MAGASELEIPPGHSLQRGTDYRKKMIVKLSVDSGSAEQTENQQWLETEW